MSDVGCGAREGTLRQKSLGSSAKQLQKHITILQRKRERAVLENEAAEVKYAALKKRGYCVYWQEEIYLNKCVRK